MTISPIRFSATLRVPMDDVMKQEISKTEFYDRSQKLSGQLTDDGDLLIVTNYPEGKDFDNLTAIEKVVMAMTEKSEDPVDVYPKPETFVSADDRNDVYPEIKVTEPSAPLSVKRAPDAEAYYQVAEKVMSDIVEGNKISAIKHIFKQGGDVGLKEAKELVDRITSKDFPVEGVVAMLSELEGFTPPPVDIVEEDINLSGDKYMEAAEKIKKYKMSGGLAKALQEARTLMGSDLKNAIDLVQPINSDTSLEDIAEKLRGFDAEQPERKRSVPPLAQKLWHDKPPSQDGLSETVQQFLDTLEDKLKSGQFGELYDNMLGIFSDGSL